MHNSFLQAGKVLRLHRPQPPTISFLDTCGWSAKDTFRQRHVECKKRIINEKERETLTGVQSPWNGNNSSIINMLTLWKPQFVFLCRFSASKLLAAAVTMAADFVYRECGDTGGNKNKAAIKFMSGTPTRYWQHWMCFSLNVSIIFFSYGSHCRMRALPVPSER